MEKHYADYRPNVEEGENMMDISESNLLEEKNRNMKYNDPMIEIKKWYLRKSIIALIAFISVILLILLLYFILYIF